MRGINFAVHRVQRVLPGACSYGSRYGCLPAHAYVDLEIESENGAIALTLFIDEPHVEQVAADLHAIADGLNRARDRALIEAPIRERMEREEAEAVAAMHARDAALAESAVSP